MNAAVAAPLTTPPEYAVRQPRGAWQPHSPGIPAQNFILAETNVRKMLDSTFIRCRVSRPFSPSESFPRSVWICPCFRPPSISARGLVLLRRTTRVPVRRKPLALVMLVPTSSLCLFSLLFAPFEKRAIPKSAIGIYLLKSA